ncbi:unnamed protein product [Gemmataceae bacterium]|nr:unnamed protein product [Gemmataceae bacterium]VTU02591.1 unnamed protein product [Gemmataceae bacterium]
MRVDHAAHNAAVAADLVALRKNAAPSVAAALAEAAAGVRFGDLLSATAEVMKRKPAERVAAVAAVAKDRRLDATALAAWADLAVVATKDPADPLYAWATWCESGRCPASSTGPVGVCDVVIDFAKPPRDRT